MLSTPGRRLKVARELLGYTQQGVADHLSQSVETYKKWEQDKATPKTNTITQRLCAYLEITIDHYINGTENTLLSSRHRTLIERYEKASPEIQQAIDLILAETNK